MRNIIFVMLLIICPMQTTCSEIKEQLLAFSKGAASTSLGMLTGYLAGDKVNQKAVGTAAGAICGILVDHYWAGGKNDPRIARKIGYTLPVLVGGVIVHYKIDDALALTIQNRIISQRYSLALEEWRESSQKYLNATSEKQGYKETDIVFFKCLRDAVFAKKGFYYIKFFRAQFGSIMTDDSVNHLLDQCSKTNRFGVTVDRKEIQLLGRIIDVILSRNPSEDSRNK